MSNLMSNHFFLCVSDLLNELVDPVYSNGLKDLFTNQMYPGLKLVPIQQLSAGGGDYQQIII